MKILFLATLDTKSEAIKYIIQRLERHNSVTFIDIGCSKFNQNYKHIYTIAGRQLGELTILDRDKAIKSVIKTLSSHLNLILSIEQPDIIIGIGGASGTSILIESIAKNPNLTPPIIILTTVWRFFEHFELNKFTILVPCVTDFDIFNSFLKRELSKFTSIVTAYSTLFSCNRKTSGKKYVITTLGSLHTCVKNFRNLLSSDIDLIPIHANGQSIKVIRTLMRIYKISGIIFLGTTEFSNSLFGGDFCAQDNPFKEIEKLDLPIYFVPGGLEFIVAVNRNLKKTKFICRKYQWNKITNLYELNDNAADLVFSEIQENFSNKEKIKIIIPLKSYSKLSEDYQPFENSGFVKKLNQNLISDKKLNKSYVDENINSIEFALYLKNIIDNS